MPMIALAIRVYYENDVGVARVDARSKFIAKKGIVWSFYRWTKEFSR
jgi:hypothetical protein